MATKSKGYNDKLDPDEQVSMEEEIASTIFDYTEKCLRFLDEEDCQRLGRDILLKVLTEFRPDLFTK